MFVATCGIARMVLFLQLDEPNVVPRRIKLEMRIAHIARCMLRRLRRSCINIMYGEQVEVGKRGEKR